MSKYKRVLDFVCVGTATPEKGTRSVEERNPLAGIVIASSGMGLAKAVLHMTGQCEPSYQRRLEGLKLRPAVSHGQ